MASAKVGQTVQVFTSRMDRQVEGIGAGPYAALVTRVFKGSMIDVKVSRPGNYPDYFLGSVMAEQDTKVEANPRIYWQPVPIDAIVAKSDVFVPPAGDEDEISGETGGDQ